MSSGRRQSNLGGPPVSSGSSSSSTHKKSNSADKRKKMRESLTSDAGRQGTRDVSGPPPKTHLLLIQGGTHSAFIGDFLALVEFFRTQTSPKFAADFWTMYSPQQYFDKTENEKHTTIKFENRVLANRHNSEHYTPAFTYIDPTQICQRVFQWLHRKSDTTHAECAKSGDSIILIILAHGSWDKNANAPVGIRLGNNDLLVDDFVKSLGEIPREVQVNVISTACYSAIFAQKITEDEQALRWIQVASQPKKRSFAAERSVSGRLQNCKFIAGLVRSLAGLGKHNIIDLKTLQTDLADATAKHQNSDNRSSPFSYSDSPLTTQVHTLLLRTFADFPFTPQNTAARRRKELNIDMLKRPYPEGAALMEKQDFAASMIAEEQNSFGDQVTDMLEESFGEIPRSDFTRKIAAGDILRGILLRGRHQAAVFDVFMQLCLQGVCSLSSLKHPLNWNCMRDSTTCFSWIMRMLAVFNCFRVNWYLAQESWGIKPEHRWVEYDVPMFWLGTMIGRSFTSLSTVFDVIRLTGQLGHIHTDNLKILTEDHQPDSDWKADINLNRPENWYGSGTFAFWLPENVDVTGQEFDDATKALSKQFYSRLERTEAQYAAYFDIKKDVFDADIQQEERDVRDWSLESP